jgi:hypothetical protein
MANLCQSEVCLLNRQLTKLNLFRVLLFRLFELDASDTLLDHLLKTSHKSVLKHSVRQVDSVD